MRFFSVNESFVYLDVENDYMSCLIVGWLYRTQPCN